MCLLPPTPSSSCWVGFSCSVRFSQSHTLSCHRSILDPVGDILFAWGLELVSFSLSIGTSSSNFHTPLQLPETNTTQVRFLLIPLAPRRGQGIGAWSLGRGRGQGQLLVTMCSVIAILQFVQIKLQQLDSSAQAVATRYPGVLCWAFKVIQEPQTGLPELVNKNTKLLVNLNFR